MNLARYDKVSGLVQDCSISSVLAMEILNHRGNHKKLTHIMKYGYIAGDLNSHNRHPIKVCCGVSSVSLKYDIYWKTSNIIRTLVGNIIVDHSDGDTAVLSALLQLHLHSRLDIWLQGIRQRQSQDSTRIFQVLGFGAPYIRDLTVCCAL